MVGGNHDYALEEDPPYAINLITCAAYLQDTAITINGFKFYGTPWQPEFHHWAFNLPRRGEELSEKWERIPEDTDILVTHTPPYGILDYSLYSKDNVGCELLRERVAELPNLKAHIFGHIHAGYGFMDRFYNVSVCNESYEPKNQPIVIEFEDKTED
jgi:Icc-related predicted phosphoesterase